jgi:hypothetical protein
MEKTERNGTQMTSKNVIVPHEPTGDMLEQMYSAGTLLEEIDLWPAGELIYKSMLSAAPQLSEAEMVERVARIISRAPFPSPSSKAKAKDVLKALGLIADEQ